MLAPGASDVGPNTRWDWPMAAITLVTVTFVKVMLPAFDTVPEITIVPPGGTGLAGQFFTTKIAGEFVPGQNCVLLLVTTRPKHLSAPLAITVSA